MNALSPLPCAGLCRHFAPDSSHCRLHGKGIEQPFEQRCDQHEIANETTLLGQSLLGYGTDDQRA